MAAQTANSGPAETFHASFVIEKHWVKEVVRAVLGAIIFHRALGSFSPRDQEVCGVTMPVPADADIEQLLNAQADAVLRALEENTSAKKTARQYLAFYPDANAPPSSVSPSRKPSIPSSASGALGWFSATARLMGADAPAEAAADKEEDRPAGGKIWEGWLIDWELDNGSGRGVRSAGEAGLRGQLNDFLLQTLMFVTQKTILVNPSRPPFQFSPAKGVSATRNTTPLLHKALVEDEREKALRTAVPIQSRDGPVYAPRYGV